MLLLSSYTKYVSRKAKIQVRYVSSKYECKSIEKEVKIVVRQICQNKNSDLVRLAEMPFDLYFSLCMCYLI